jgi:hypothetical protein
MKQLPRAPETGALETQTGKELQSNSYLIFASL